MLEFVLDMNLSSPSVSYFFVQSGSMCCIFIYFFTDMTQDKFINIWKLSVKLMIMIIISSRRSRPSSRSNSIVNINYFYYWY